MPASANEYSNGFETGTSGWTGATQTPSGTGGITASSGTYFATIPSGNGSYTQYGGYVSSFPTGGFTTSLDIYLNLSATTTNGTLFDWSNAISDTSGAHRRDFIFNGGFFNDTDATGSGARFVFTASNNSQPGSAYAKNPARDPFAITSTGWYTFKDRFYDAGAGVLAVDLSILNSSGTTLHTWTLSDSSDIIGSTVGGNRYGWFDLNQFSSLAIDNSKLEYASTVPEPKTWLGMMLAFALLGVALRKRGSDALERRAA